MRSWLRSAGGGQINGTGWGQASRACPPFNLIDFQTVLMATPSDTAQRFVGAWLLISPTENGMIYYDGSGLEKNVDSLSPHMIVQSAPKRSRPRAGTKPTPAEALDALDGYVAYFGTYTIDEAASTVTHHQADTVQPGSAVDLVRAYEFQSDTHLILRPVEGGVDGLSLSGSGLHERSWVNEDPAG